MKTIRLIIVGLFLFLTSCGTYEQGNFVVRYNDLDHKATAVQTIDEENKVKYKTLEGKIETFKGSFEIYQE